MSKMGQELDKRLEKNKYEMWEVIKFAKGVISIFDEYNQNCKTSSPPPSMIKATGELISTFSPRIDKVLTKIAGGK